MCQLGGHDMGSTKIGNCLIDGDLCILYIE